MIEAIRSILIFDDESDFRKLTHSILKTKYDENILHEYDPLALGAPDDSFDWSQHDVLLLDHHLQLEKTTGLDILQYNKDNPDFPVTIMLTASNDEEIAFKALKLGISDFIRKQELTKKILFNSIDNAIVAKKKKLEQQRKLKKIQRIFNKRYFHKTLKTNIESVEQAQKRIIIGLRVAESEPNQTLDEFAKDRITRHIAKESCRYFMENNFHPFITLFSEDTVVILTDVKDKHFDEKELIKNLHLYNLATPYKNNEKPVDYYFTSCGLTLTEKTVDQQQLKNYFDIACKKTEQITDLDKRIFITNIQQLQTPSDTQEISESEQTLSQDDFNHEMDYAEPPASNDTKDNDYQLNIDIDKLDEDSKLIISAINDHRIIKTFQPIITLSGRDEELLADGDIYYLSSSLIDKDDNEVNSDDFLNKISNQDVIKFYDRWLVKETIKNVIDIKPSVSSSFFLLKLKLETLRDPSFFNWLRALLNEYENLLPGRYIIFEITYHSLKENNKQVVALINYLRNSHSFNFAISGITDMSELTEIINKIDFLMLISSHDKLSELLLVETTNEESENFIGFLRRTHRYVLASDISDSISLTTAITNGADLAMGEFIGSPKASFEGDDAIQSFEIESDEFVSSRL